VVSFPNEVKNMSYKINGINAFSGNIVMKSDVKCEIKIKDSYFSIEFIEDGGENITSTRVVDGKLKIIFKNTLNTLGTSTEIPLPLTGGGKTIINFAIFPIGEESTKTIVLNYTYRDEK